MGPTAHDTSWIPLDDAVRVGIQQTLRVPDAGGPYPLPPALGRLPVRAAADVPALAAGTPSNAADFVVALHVQEAIWLQFHGIRTEPRAVKVAVGSVDALTGRPWTLRLEFRLRTPLWPPAVVDDWTGRNRQQFVAVPLPGCQWLSSPDETKAGSR